MPFFVFTVCLLVYLRTLHHSVAGGDSGELVTVAYQLGVAHPPGYPLYTMLAHAFTWIPFGSIAWRVNLFSAICGAAAAAFLFDLVRRSTKDASAAAVAAFLFAFSPLVWTYAIQAEVFALHNLFLAALLWLAQRWNHVRDARAANRIAFAIGLGLSHHHTLVLVALPVVVWMLFLLRGVPLRPRALATFMLWGTAGLLPYLYLPLASLHATTLSWGDAGSVSGFLDMLLRRDYGTLRLSGDAAVTASGFAHHLVLIARSFTEGSLLIGPVLVALAVARPWSRGTQAEPGAAFIVLLATALVFSSCVFAAMANLPLDDPFYVGVTSRFWQQPQLIAFVLLGIGFARVRSAFAPAAPWLAVALVAMQLALQFRNHDESANYFIENYGRAILAGLPEGALLLVHGDLISNAVRYVQTCERVRPDVVILDQEMMTKPWYIRRAAAEHTDVVFAGRTFHPHIVGSFDMKTFIAVNRLRRSIHVYPAVKAGDVAWQKDFALVPDGVSQRVIAKGEWSDAMVAEVAGVASGAALDPLRSLGRPDEERYPPGTWEHVVLTDHRELFHTRGRWLLDRAVARGDVPDLFRRAREALTEAASLWPGPPPWYVSKNLGLAASHLAARDPAERTRTIDAWSSYLAHAPADEKDRAAIVAALRDLER